MHDKRWDCSTLKYAPKFKRDLRKGTSERAFVHSLSSAAVGINVAKRCALGDLDKCGCNERPQDDHLDEKVNMEYKISIHCSLPIWYRQGDPVYKLIVMQWSN